MCRWKSTLTPNSHDIAEVLDDLQLQVHCSLTASLDETEQQYVKLFVHGTRREDPILDVYLYEDGDYPDVGDAELDDDLDPPQRQRERVSPNLLEEDSINLLNCLSPANNSMYIENPLCGNKSTFSNSSKIHSYFVVGNMLVSDLEESCTVDMVAWASSDIPLQENTSYSAIHDFLAFGFELTWYCALCRECYASKGTCIAEDNQIRCRHYCYEDTPLSERTFRCKLEYYAPKCSFYISHCSPCDWSNNSTKIVMWLTIRTRIDSV
ncbi:unnamed protein product [Fraxinus pennsylvanica]|uniref:Wall-associated receptor kinase C-terminal domain-containing protein n=1 Tax=Fraxinus pennsylvanica TaxID=56036 RepID=A0AAD1ZPX8_9LAMI|nr:unnamed protein product [Fraxinus pennsylvanica]